MDCSYYGNTCTCECRYILRWMQRANQVGFRQDNPSIFSYKQLVEIYEKTSFLHFEEIIAQNFSKIKAINFCKNYINCNCCERHKKNRLNMNEIFYKEKDHMEI